MDNPLFGVVRTLLLKSPERTWREYDLIAEMVSKGSLDDSYGTTSLGLFQAHFLTRNALYSMREELLELGYLLCIGSIQIRLLSASGEVSETGELVAGDVASPALAEFYLNWENFQQATEDSVDDLLQVFWTRYMSIDEASDALSVLGLEAGTSYDEIRRRYKRLVMEQHPDRGGSSERVAALNHAMDVLKRRYD